MSSRNASFLEGKTVQGNEYSPPTRNAEIAKVGVRIKVTMLPSTAETERERRVSRLLLCARQECQRWDLAALGTASVVFTYTVHSLGVVHDELHAHSNNSFEKEGTNLVSSVATGKRAPSGW